MAIKNFNFIVDTINVNNNIVANVKQLDSAIFNITITENNQLKDLTNQTLKLFVKKADSSILVQTDNISITDSKNGKISININNSIFARAGIVIAEIDINGADGEWALLFAWSTQGATDGGTVIQLFYGLTSKRLFYRMFNDSGWRDWAEIVTTDTLNKSLEDIKTLIDTKIQEIKPVAVEGITENSNGIILEDNQSWKSFSAKRTVNNQLGSLELGIDTQYNNPALSLHFLLNKTLQSTFEMLVNGEFKLKDNIGTGTTALLFCNNNGETDKGWIGKYNNDQFTIKANSDDLVLTNNYGSNIRVGQGGYFYPDSDGHWALGKSGYRWSNLYTKNITNSSDRNLKENIKYLNTTATNFKDTSITTNDLYNFVKDNLKLATYDYKTEGNEDEYSKGKLGFIAQDFLNSPIGQSILQQEDNKYLSYDLNNYINLLAGALQKAILNIENLKELSQLSSSTTLKTSLLGTQISNLTMQNLQLQQRLKALENKLNINN